MTIIDKIEKGVIISIIISIVLYFAMFKTSDLNEVKDKISDIGFLTIAILLLLTHLLFKSNKTKLLSINIFSIDKVV